MNVRPEQRTCATSHNRNRRRTIARIKDKEKETLHGAIYMNTVKVFHEGGPVPCWRKMVLKAKVKVVERLPSCKNSRHEHVRFALTGILSKRLEF